MRQLLNSALTQYCIYKYIPSVNYLFLLKQNNANSAEKFKNVEISKDYGKQKFNIDVRFIFLYNPTYTELLIVILIVFINSILSYSIEK